VVPVAADRGILSSGNFLNPHPITLSVMKGKFMDERTRELIAIGASVGAHCQPCLTYHVEKARELGMLTRKSVWQLKQGIWWRKVL
jgi:AhpD family alkylhydroperoxidase